MQISDSGANYGLYWDHNGHVTDTCAIFERVVLYAVFVHSSSTKSVKNFEIVQQNFETLETSRYCGQYSSIQ